MGSGSNAYIAGVGFTPLPSNASGKAGITALVSAATKALLDAGVTYDDVTQGVRTAKSSNFNYGADAFKVFDEGGIKVEEAKAGSELDVAVKLVKEQGAACVLMVAVEKSAAIAMILASEDFIWSRAYLKDSSAIISELNSSSDSQAEGLYDVCQIVWALRGWLNFEGVQTGKSSTLNFKAPAGHSYELGRADSTPIPEWKHVEHRNDGKHRLGYNPATETKDISLEDFEAVRAQGQGNSDSISVKRKGGDRAALAKL